MELDLNSDLGEGCAADTELMPLITSANIGCGFHAGDATTARAALRLAAQHGVQAGAHPGYADRENFGRRELQRSEDQVYEECVYQVGALNGLARAEGVALRYLKPHGALYNQACRDAAYARPVVAAAKLFGLAVMGLPGSQIESAAAGGCPFIAEGFADRRYRPDGALVPRSEANAFVEDADEAVRQAEWLLSARGVRTLCVHGDNPRVLDFVRRLRAALLQQGVTLRPFGS
jgi:5-oxoprolinase (ATP-hydrolysing) subunit A